MIDTTEEAARFRTLASEWHGGQSSPLYAYSSSGTILQPGISREIRQCLSEIDQGLCGMSDVVGETAEDYRQELNELLTHVTTLLPEESDGQPTLQL